MQTTQRPASNLALARIFHQMASCYRYLGIKERFRAIAYEKVSKVLNNMTDDIAQYAGDIKTLDSIGGIGESIAEKIIEYLHSGQISTFEQLKKKVPFELIELMEVTGVGPAMLHSLHDELGISTREELLDALKMNRLSTLKNFGAKKIDIIRQALKEPMSKSRIPLAKALATGNELLNEIKKIPNVHKAAIAGSIRRKRDAIGDIDIVITAESTYRKRIADRLIKLPQVEKILAKGINRISMLLKNKIQVDIRIVHDSEFGAAMLYFTGSKEHNIRLRAMAAGLGYKINEYGIFDAGSSKRLAGDTEEGIYAFLKLNYIEPEQRLGKNEIEKAKIK